MKFIKALPAIFLFAVSIQSCCEPEYKDSYPRVIYDTYRDTMIYDLMPATGDTIVRTDSGYYPIYEFAVKNEGADADSFTMIIGNLGYGPFPITKFVLPGETVIFRTADGPISDTAEWKSQELFYSFFSKDTNNLRIQELQPFLAFRYGEVNNGDEGCNTPASQVEIDTRLFR
jgi:hypothetical protein